MSKASLELGGGNWAAKDTKLLGYAVGDTSGKYLAREFTFSRGADIAATRVNKDGLVEKYRENLLLQSNQFDTTWSQNDVSVTSSQAGYDGTNDAWLVTKDASSNSYLRQNFTAFNDVRTFSVYAKAGTLSGINIQSRGSVTYSAQFDLSDGTTGSDANEIVSNISSVGNGWWRCSVTFDASSADQVRIFVCTDGSTVGSTVGTIYIQDAQFEYGLVATDYLESGSTTGKAGVLDNLPRIDYTSGSAQLLMEPSRTNYVQYSEGPDAFLGNATRTHATSEVDPTGNIGSVVEVSNLQGASGDRQQLNLVTIDAADRGKDFTGSLYVKGTSGETITYRIKRANPVATFVGSDEVQLTLDGTWQRIEATMTSLADTLDCNFYLINKTADTADTILVWGGQIEIGSYATSYIPTYGAQDTRTFDNVQELTSTSSTGITNNYNTTVFFDGSVFRNTGNARIVTLFDASVAENPRVLLYLAENSGNHKVLAQYRVSGQADVLTDTGYDYDFGDRIKMAMRLDGTSLDLFVNGVKQSTATIVQGDPIEVLRLMDVSADLGHFFNDFQVFSSSLSDAECIALTTL